ncbi:CASP-like protein 1D1 [Juglans microcarpa x Juglans regia]|uniref:CASP-like protein 1D1 n=1 Tax=Juglans microcarpa x Juglans regia TaxID=2249226 RepID=UPI001B7EF9B6|nr:CASP-like protein 1D1 [Juglans microcarpa x Juglans regia]
MASSADPKSDQEYGKGAPPRPDAPAVVNFFAIDVALRVLLFAAAVTGVVVMVTSKQTKWTPGLGDRDAKFKHSPAFIYYVVALSIAGLYALISILASISVLSKPNFQTKFLLHFAFLDVLMLGIVASATGSAGGVAYVGLKGNKHVGWIKVCSTYDKFCQHLAGSLAVSLFACVLLVFLTWLSIFSLHARIHK